MAGCLRGIRLFKELAICYKFTDYMNSEIYGKTIWPFLGLEWLTYQGEWKVVEKSPILSHVDTFLVV